VGSAHHRGLDWVRNWWAVPTLHQEAEFCLEACYVLSRSDGAIGFLKLGRLRPSFL